MDLDLVALAFAAFALAGFGVLRRSDKDQCNQGRGSAQLMKWCASLTVGHGASLVVPSRAAGRFIVGLQVGLARRAKPGGGEHGRRAWAALCQVEWALAIIVGFCMVQDAR